MNDLDIALPSARDLVPTDRNLLPAPMEALQEVANMLAGAGALVPKDLRGKPDICLAVAYMAALHGTDPVATASQTYLVNDKIAFMAQYINAIVQRHLAEKPVYAYQGAGQARAVQVSVKLKTGQVLTYNSPQLGQIHPKNSPLWKSDPDQQLAYYAIRALARRHMPDVLLGIYAVEELQQISIRDVTPPPPDPFGDDPEPTNELEHVEDADEEDAVVETFEPSGGFTTSEEPVKHTGTPSAEIVADDILAWAEECKADAREAKTPQALQAIWDAVDHNRRKLWREERLAHDELEQVFKDQLAEIANP